MPVKLSPPIEETFILTKTDKLFKNEGEPTFVKVAQANQGQHDERMSLWAYFSRSENDEGKIEVRQRISPAEVRKLEVFLTLKDCNLQDEKGNQLFQFPLKREAFDRAWGSLPPFIADEIHENVLKVNTPWDGEQGESE